MIKIQLNGKEKEFSAQSDLRSVIVQSCRNSQHVIAEVNGTIVKKTVWENTLIKNGDTVELVSMVGGG